MCVVLCYLSKLLTLFSITAGLPAAASSGARDVQQPSHPRRAHRGQGVGRPYSEGAMVPGVQGHGRQVRYYHYYSSNILLL